MGPLGVCLNIDCPSWSDEVLAAAGTCRFCGHLAPRPPGLSWALDLNTATVSAPLVLEVAQGCPPALHAATPTRSGIRPVSSLAGLGWRTVTGWTPRSWGALAPVEPGSGIDDS